MLIFSFPNLLDILIFSFSFLTVVTALNKNVKTKIKNLELILSYPRNNHHLR